MKQKTKNKICGVCDGSCIDERVLPKIPCNHPSYWEEEIDLFSNPFEIKKNKIPFVEFSKGNRYKNILINQYIGIQIYKKLSPETRYVVLKEASKEFHRQMESIYGSMSNYLRKWVKNNLGISWNEYQEELAKQRGFKNQYEYKKFIVKRLGFNSYSNYQNYLVKKRGFKNRTDYEIKRIKSKGFKNWREYVEFCAKKKGFKNYSERRKVWCEKKNET